MLLTNVYARLLSHIMLTGKHERPVSFVLELYTSKHGARTPLDHFTTGKCSLDDAMDQAKSIMRNVMFEGEMATLCLIKDERNTVLCEVLVDANRP
jgi:hypothetical protein